MRQLELETIVLRGGTRQKKVNFTLTPKTTLATRH